jgi:hypothetical protein
VAQNIHLDRHPSGIVIPGCEVSQAPSARACGTEGRTGRLTSNPVALAAVHGMIRRRARRAGIKTKICCHTFCATTLGHIGELPKGSRFYSPDVYRFLLWLDVAVDIAESVRGIQGGSDPGATSRGVTVCGSTASGTGASGAKLRGLGALQQVASRWRGIIRAERLRGCGVLGAAAKR